ncbi:MAG: hypothetical protein WA197_15400 [Candidatus Acidiferrales bacterium]
MELFLNIFWFAIAIAGVILWRTRWTREDRIRRHARWREWTAFVCSMVLLFFVVSLTDDLHAELMLIEECSGSRRHAACVACPHHSSPENRNATHPWAVLPPGPNFGSLAFVAPVLSTPGIHQSVLDLQSTFGRAPPVSIV